MSRSRRNRQRDLTRPRSISALCGEQVDVDLLLLFQVQSPPVDEDLATFPPVKYV